MNQEDVKTESPTPASALRLLLVDDHAVMRSGLANMLNARAEFEVAAEADNGLEAIELYKEHQPDLTLMDVVMPGIGGIECLRQIKEFSPESLILMLSSSEREHDIFQAMEAGADGYITKTASPAELVQSILAVSNGESYISDEISRRLSDYSDAPQLSPRELEVIRLLRHGMSNGKIGEEMGITPRTAKAHVASILLKLGAKDRTEAVARGFEQGLLR